MPVEASDIVQTAMDTGDHDSTGCEETSRESDERVRKMPTCTGAATLSNQIHSTEEIDQRKPWKSGPSFEFHLQTRPCQLSTFSADAASLLWETRKQKIFSEFIFLMHSNGSLCQTD